MINSNYDKHPFIEVPNGRERCYDGWKNICKRLSEEKSSYGFRRVVLTCECYCGVHVDEIIDGLLALRPMLFICSSDAFFPAEKIDKIVAPFNGGDNPVFGRMSNLCMADFMNPQKIDHFAQEIDKIETGLVVVLGNGATLIHPGDILVYADLTRREAQLRMRRNEISNLGTENSYLKWSLQYKRAYFTDWRVCDRLKRKIMNRWDFVLDTNTVGKPCMAEGDVVRRGLHEAARRPFRVVPFFDPAPWGGQWMKEVCDLDHDVENFGWCFDCVPEENSLLLKFGGNLMEVPSINVVFQEPRALLGEKVQARYGDEFPIRFDLLDTMGGGNLSFQVHPLTEYIQSHFGMHFTQDESYYILDADNGASVYLGTREGIDPQEMIENLESAKCGGKGFEADQFVNQWPANKHDHFLIPAGTCHCSGANSVVLEISATPYIFTFKLWDWGRLGLDGLPRPINLDHGRRNIQWERTTRWVRENLINQVDEIATGDGWREERTGLHELEFIESRRHWFRKRVEHDTGGGVNVLNLVEGREAVIESPSGAFKPFVVHYAETFIVPASVGPYSIRPFGDSEGKECATMKAFVRT